MTADDAHHEESFMNTSTCPETDAASASQPQHAPAATSTLIEFPGTGRSRPQWRKDLSERVREIQQRRALEAAREASDSVRPDAAHLSSTANVQTSDTPESVASPLGLVPALEPQEVNPIVAKALERVERARQQRQQPNLPRGSSRGGAAAAVNTRASEESYHAPVEAHEPAAESRAGNSPTGEFEELAAKPLKQAEATQNEATKQVETARATNLVVVPPAPLPASETDALIKEALDRPRPRRHLAEVADDALLARREASTPTQAAVVVDDVKETAPLARRFVSGIADLIIVAFASSPFAAVMELTSGNWHDPRVAGSLAGVVAVIMFVYLTASVALTGRTMGMTLVSVRAIDERNGLIPTAGQCARRAFFYMVSLATLGVGFLPAIINPERRALHDRLSGTLVAPAK
jgi:uncharacterized RDD family membrane protein YckC